MRKFVLLFTGLLLVTFTATASATSTNTATHYYNYGKSFIFTEGGVEFSVYPDGQFDFYLNGSRNGISVNVNTPGVNISFNSGFNYDPFVQYDDYGAVVQIEDTPIFYDHYGRIIQAGDVFIRYNHWGRVSRVGGLFVNYNSYGRFLNCTGYINSFNRYYVYRPFHAYFAVPVVDRCIVWNRPYRRFYSPYRFSYAVYRNNYYNGYYSRSYRNRSYYRPGSSVRNFNRGRRIASARNVKFRSRDSRRTMYQRNDRNYRTINSNRPRVATRNNRSVTRSRTVTKNTRAVSKDRLTRDISTNRTQTRGRSRKAVADRSYSSTSKYDRVNKGIRTQRSKSYSGNRSANRTKKRSQNSRYNSNMKRERSNTRAIKRGANKRSKRNTNSRSSRGRG